MQCQQNIKEKIPSSTKPMRFLLFNYISLPLPLAFLLPLLPSACNPFTTLDTLIFIESKLHPTLCSALPPLPYLISTSISNAHSLKYTVNH